MCTLSYIPNTRNKGEFIVTDNRDESVERPAHFPEVYQELNTELLYPKDKTAGGTWIGISRKKQMMALMNGAFKQHERKKSYKKSRGLVVKELLAADDIKKAFEEYDLEGIEAFFAVVFTWNVGVEIYEMIWDEKNAYLNAMDASKPHLWSAAMTYSAEQHQHKLKAFEGFLIQNQDSDNIAKEVWDFHQLRELNGKEGMVIDRGILKTTSVTQYLHSNSDRNSIRYKDLITGKEGVQEVSW